MAVIRLFDKFIDFWKGVTARMFSKQTVQDALGIHVAASTEMIEAIQRWTAMFEEKESKLRLPSAIASEMARLVTIEMKSEITGSKRADYLNEIYGRVIAKAKINTEFAAAKGAVVFKPYVADGEMGVDCIGADAFYPTKYNTSGDVVGGVFIERIYAKNNVVYTRLERHEFVGEQYIITNRAFKSESDGVLGREISLTSVPEWSNLESSVSLDHVTIPLFAYYKMPMANCVDSTSPLGVSIYAKAEKLIADAEKQYRDFLWEFESGERKLYIASTALKRDENGNPIYPKNKRLYQMLETDDTSLHKEFSPPFREENYINGLNAILRRIEYNVGLAYGTLSDVQDSEKTAEEVRASKQRSYATVCDIQKNLQTALEQLVGAMDALCTLYKLAPSGEYDISFEWDDSIVVDRKTEYQVRKELVSLGSYKPWELRMWYFGEDEETAKAMCAEDDNEFNLDE